MAASWGSKQFSKIAAEVAAALLAKVKDESANGEERVAAARELLEADAKDTKTIDAILEQINARTCTRYQHRFSAGSSKRSA